MAALNIAVSSIQQTPSPPTMVTACGEEKNIIFPFILHVLSILTWLDWRSE